MGTEGYKLRLRLLPYGKVVDMEPDERTCAADLLNGVYFFRAAKMADMVCRT
jgi:hypothetical protein